MDILSFIGLIIGIGAIIGGQLLEGGYVASLVNGPACVIVVGGTIGAAMLQSPINIFISSLKMSLWVIFPSLRTNDISIEKIIHWSHIARKEGLLGLEDVLENESDSFSQKGLQLLVDGNEPDVIRNVMKIEMDTRKYNGLQAAKVFEAMSRYSIAIGIMGTSIGIVQVMPNLPDTTRLGAGIATAFVATIYGLGLANLILLPMASKLMSHVKELAQYHDMVIEGIISIADGENPRNIETKLHSFLNG